MRRTMTLAIAMAASILLPAAPAVGADDASPEPSTGPNPVAGEIDWLFVQNSESGTLEAVDDGSYQLVLLAVDEDTIAFSDTPYRQVDSMATSDVVDVINAATDKPNAALQVTSPSPVTVVLSLIEGTYDSDSQTLTYAAELLADGSLGDLVGDGDLPEGSFAAPALFIDGEEATVSGGGVFALDATCQAGSFLSDHHCWTIKPGESYWPQDYPSLGVSFNNPGSREIEISTGLLCALGHVYKLPAGTSTVLYFHHKNQICLNKDEVRIGEIFEGSSGS